MKSILPVMLLLSAFACVQTELEKSIFIPDEEFPELPQYSEWGYNVFGAYYDRQPVISNHFEVPVKVIHQNNATSFVFTGQRGVGRYDDNNLFSFTLSLSDFQPVTYTDLIALHNTTLDLTDPAKTVIITHGPAIDTAQILNGEFQIKRAQHLLVDQKLEEVILSGVFEFQALVDGIPVTVSSGRFDVGVGESNFFVY